jgi:hypothetical protein
VIYLAFASRCLIGLVFVLSAASKLRNRRAFDDFVGAIRQLLTAVVPGRVWGRATVRGTGVAVIAAEVVIPILLAVPGLARAGFAVAAGLLVAFTVAIAAVLRRGTGTACHCFGAAASPLGPVHLVRNGILLIIAGTGLVVGGVGLDGAAPAGLVVAGAAALVAAVVLTRLDDIVDLFSADPLAAARRNGSGPGGR